LREVEAWTGASSERNSPGGDFDADPAFFLYTSGSGGNRKAAVHRHADMLVTSQVSRAGRAHLTKKTWTFSVSKLFLPMPGNGCIFPCPSAHARF